MQFVTPKSRLNISEEQKEQFIRETQNSMAKLSEFARQSKTPRDFLLKVVDNVFAKDDPEGKFYNWFLENSYRLRDAMKEIDIKVESGEGFYTRLKEAYLNKIKEMDKIALRE